jgi:hypothetical protein
MRVWRANTKSFKPILQRSVRRFSKLAVKAALATQAQKIAGARSGNDKPCCLDLAFFDDFGALKHEGALAPTEFSARW